ncbi:hypothetical protein SHKM778_46820 [Streptomyces sp. KM77-8]|uniref:Uncharacterized protein n=1 Tax=Streptomyces haneummycinicus TaxID=3074435 RepID=A0AAT9HLV7_9ACTN
MSVLGAEPGAGRLTQAAWRQGSEGERAPRLAVLTVRPAGKRSLAAAREAASGRNRWSGVLPTSALLAHRPARTLRRTTGYRTIPRRLRPPTWCGGRRCADAWYAGTHPDSAVCELGEL